MRGPSPQCEAVPEFPTDVLLLGCAGMTMISDELHALSDLPIIDPIKAGVEQLKAMVRGGFPVSRAGLYA